MMTGRKIGSVGIVRNAMVPPSIQRIDKFDVLQRLGRGGMGSVYLARDPDIDRLVAIKLLHEGFDDEVRGRFNAEARSASALRHTNIVTIFQTGTFLDRPFIVMEYIAGETFADIVASRRPMSVADKLQLLDQLLAGLQYAHAKGVVHRDIKPSNVMVDSEGVVRILDFGIARLGGGGLTRTGAVLGTINYMSPEQLAGEVVDARADIFAVGLIGYELLTSTPAFPQLFPETVRHIVSEDPPPIEELSPGIDPGLVRVVKGCLAKRADDRYADCNAVRRDLDVVRQAMERSVETALRVPVPPLPPTPSVASPTLVISRRPSVSGRGSAAATDTSSARARRRVLKFVAAALALFISAGGIWRLMKPGESSDSVEAPAPASPQAAVAVPGAQVPPPVVEPLDRERGAAVVAEISPGDRLRSQAADAWKRGDVEIALISIAAAMQLGPDSATDRLLAQFSGSSRDRAAAARRRALSANGRGTAAYTAGDERLFEGDRLTKQGQGASAVRAFVDATQRFEEATRSAPPPAPVRVGGAVKPPRQVRRVSPEYPVEALSSRVQGVVILETTIGTDGRIRDVRVARSIPLLDEAAVQAVRQWVYEPTIVNDVPVPVIISVAVEFKLTAPQPIRVGGAIKPPAQTKRVTPPYPPEAQAAGVQGLVIMEATIGVDGKVTDVRVLRSIPLLDRAAMDAVRQFEYAPTVVNGVVVPVIMTVTVNFTLTRPATQSQPGAPSPAK
jgi:serine/threonine-protein kinase